MKASDEEKKTWKEQITSAVQLLHTNGMVWGDVKPDNVMIERSTGRAILIDFGGGHNERWVEAKLQETKEGDLQGLSRLVQHISNLKT